MKAPRIRFEHWSFRLPGMMDGVVLFPFILFRSAPLQVSRRLYRHELEHYYQVQREGWWRFYLKYLWLTLRHGYWNNPYEVAARAAEQEALTQQEVDWWAEAVSRHILASIDHKDSGNG